MDLFFGEDGNDSYVVDNPGDRLLWDYADSGIDEVRSAKSWTLGAYQENLALLETAANGTGNAGANTLLGNGIANRLWGLGGNDVDNGRAATIWWRAAQGTTGCLAAKVRIP